MFDVITCGSATFDVFVQSHNEVVKIDKGSNHIHKLIAYESGAKILIDELLYAIGGGGTNTAVSFSRIGLKTGYVGCIGNDESAQAVIELLSRERIAFLGHTAEQKTGYSIILDSKEHDRTILAYKGANNDLRFKNLVTKNLKAQWYYFSSMVGKSFSAQVALAKYAKSQKGKIAFNPSQYQVKQGIRLLKPVLDYTNVLLCNKEEVCILCKTDDVHLAMRTLYSIGVQIIVVTDGPNDLYCFDGKTIYTVTPPHAKVVEATGAGDAFASSFVAWYMKTESIEQSIKAGLVNSMSILSHFGSKKELLSSQEIEKRIIKLNVKIHTKEF